MNFNTAPRRPSDPRVVIVYVIFGAVLGGLCMFFFLLPYAAR